MRSSAQAFSDAAGDSYRNITPGEIANDQKPIFLDGQRYKVFGYADDLVSGFHGTAYQDIKTFDVVIAYRGTDPGLFTGPDKLGHAATTLQDIAVDAAMVRDKTNAQMPAADNFTQAMLAKVAAQGISKDRVTVVGHSLGGTLAQAEAAKFHLNGVTFDAFGAVGIVPDVPEGGDSVTNYVMAGDIVSAANTHYGQVVPLASDKDLEILRNDRYLNAPPGAAAPNPIRDIMPSLGDHSLTANFSGANSILSPTNFAHAQQNYAQNKRAVDAYRNDILRESRELTEALRQDHIHYGKTQLPPDIQRQLNESLAVNADAPVQRLAEKYIEHNAVATEVEHRYQQGADIARASGQTVRSFDERAAAGMRSVGDAMVPLNPAAPLIGAAAGELAHLHGQAANATGQYVADRLEGVKHGVEQGTHDFAQGAAAQIHNPEVQAQAVKGINAVIGAYDASVKAGQHIEQVGQTVTQGIQGAEQGASQAIDETKRIVSTSVDAAEQVADKAYDALTYPGQLLHPAAPSTPTQGTALSSRQALPAHALTLDDPRHRGNPNNGLFKELEKRIPEASENRLLQLTAACHQKGITERNLQSVHLVEQTNTVVIRSGGLQPETVAVDVNQPSPQPQQSIHRIQQQDMTQTANHAQIQQQIMQTNMQGQQGPAMGGPGMGH